MDVLSLRGDLLDSNQVAYPSPDRVARSHSAEMTVSKAEEKETLREVCGEFESLFLQYMLKGMRATIPTGGDGGMGHSKEMYTSMMDEQLARELALKGGGIGLAEVLFRQLYRDERDEGASEPR